MSSRTEATPAVRAAGAVLWRAGHGGQLEVALVHRPKYDDWSLPKGKLDKGEHVLVAAVREVHEETGQQVTLNHPLPTQHYLVDGGVKEVRYWAARASHDGGFSATREIDDVRWLPPGTAQTVLTHPRDADLVACFAAKPVRTVPLVLVRHAPAVGRKQWDGDDAERPLDDKGRAMAARLVELLATYGVQRVISSPAFRCLDTVAPYADAAGLGIEEATVFSETGFAAARDRGDAFEEAATLLGSTVPTVVSSHRPVLPEVAADLCRRSGVRPPARGLEAGAFWVVHVAEGRVVAVEEHAVDTE